MTPGIVPSLGWLADGHVRICYPAPDGTLVLVSINAATGAARSTALIAPPAPAPSPGLKPPAVNVVSYSTALTPDGTWTAVMADDNNPGYGWIVEFVNGSFHFTASNPAGDNRSGKDRPVEIG